MPYKDIEKRREHARKYYHKNKEKLNREARERFNNKSPEKQAKIRAQIAHNTRRWRKNNPERVKEIQRKSEKRRKEKWGEKERRLKITHTISMGGKCMFCGYNRHISALDFHHVVPLKKEGIRNRDVRREKMDYSQFILLCSNCHRELHARVRSMPSLLPRFDPDAGMVSFDVHLETIQRWE